MEKLSEQTKSFCKDCIYLQVEKNSIVGYCPKKDWKIKNIAAYCCCDFDKI